MSERALQLREDSLADSVTVTDHYHIVDSKLAPLWERERQSATQVSQWSLPLKKVFLPLAVAASLYGPMPMPEVRRSYRVSALTQLVDMQWEIDEDYWEPVPQLITNQQVAALNSLLSMPYVTGPGIGDLYDD